MTTLSLPSRVPWGRAAQAALPVGSLVALLIVVFALEPNASTYRGFTLVLSGSTGLIFAAMAQLCLATLGDIDLGVGAAIGLANVVCATWLATKPALGLLALLGIVAGYVLLGLVVHVRRVSAIVATLGASFVWLGLGLLLLPTPGGLAPEWLTDWFALRPVLVPLPVVIAVVTAVVAYLVFMRTRFGLVARGSGVSPDAIRHSGRPLVVTQVAVYALAGLCVVLSGLAVTANTTSGDVNASSGYTLLSIAAVVLGGTSFAGGRITPVGAVLGAVSLTLVTSLLAFLNVSSDYQVGAEGLILFAVVAVRALAGRRPA